MVGIPERTKLCLEVKDLHFITTETFNFLSRKVFMMEVGVQNLLKILKGMVPSTCLTT